MMWRLSLLLVVALPAGLWGQAPASQPAAAQAVTTRLSQSFDRLADADAAVREAARTALMGMSPADLPAFRRVVAEARPLLPSQAAVVREIVCHVHLASQPYPKGREGFLGVRLSSLEAELTDTAPPANGILIEQRILGFAGYQHLYDGDVIIGVAGPQPLRFRSQTEFILAVQRMRAGTVVPFQVLRLGQLIEVAIPLSARPADLDEAAFESTQIQRQRAADAYWEKHFAPLLADDVS